MNSLAEIVHKPGMLHSDMHSKTQPHYSTTMQPYIIHVAVNLVCQFSVNWHATSSATYVGTVVEYCGCVMECTSLCGISCLCTLLASEFIEPSLHQLDFFLEIFLDNVLSSTSSEHTTETSPPLLRPELIHWDFKMALRFECYEHLWLRQAQKWLLLGQT